MPKFKFSELDAAEKRAVFWLADEAGTLTPFITDAMMLPGELWEAKAFLKHFPRGSAEHTELANRLRVGGASSETILECIERAAPTYETLGQRYAAELAEFLPLPPELAEFFESGEQA